MMSNAFDFLKNISKKRYFRALILFGPLPSEVQLELETIPPFNKKEFIPPFNPTLFFLIDGFFMKVAFIKKSRIWWIPLPFLTRFVLWTLKRQPAPIGIVRFSSEASQLNRFERFIVLKFNELNSFFFHFYPHSTQSFSLDIPYNSHKLFEGTARVDGTSFHLDIISSFSLKQILTQSKPIRVLAIMTAYNEGDIIQHTIAALIQQNIDVYLIDNWSTDSTYKKASQFLGKGLIGIEKFPSDSPSQYYQWGELLKRVDALASTMPYDWIIHHDADEIRYGPWEDFNLKESLQIIDFLGYTAADHCLLNFQPVDNGYSSDISPETYFKFFEFGKSIDTPQIKAWKNQSSQVFLDKSGGHIVLFPELKVFPFQFIIKHYRIRSDAHGLKKVFQDRKPRWDPKERRNGWHVQYDAVESHASFTKSPEECFFFDRASFYTTYLIERLTWL